MHRCSQTGEHHLGGTKAPERKTTLKSANTNLNPEVPWFGILIFSKTTFFKSILPYLESQKHQSISQQLQSTSKQPQIIMKAPTNQHQNVCSLTMFSLFWRSKKHKQKTRFVIRVCPRCWDDCQDPEKGQKALRKWRPRNGERISWMIFREFEGHITK